MPETRDVSAERQPAPPAEPLTPGTEYEIAKGLVERLTSALIHNPDFQRVAVEQMARGINDCFFIHNDRFYHFMRYHEFRRKQNASADIVSITSKDRFNPPLLLPHSLDRSTSIIILTKRDGTPLHVGIHHQSDTVFTLRERKRTNTRIRQVNTVQAIKGIEEEIVGLER